MDVFHDSFGECNYSISRLQLTIFIVKELYGNQCPYAGLGTPAVTLAISRKELPKIPDPQHDSFAIYDSFVRSLCTGDWCWNPNPKERPSMAAIVDFLNE
jgi:hypothetical protein